MFEAINRKASIGVRIGLIAACAAPPIALLLFLFIAPVADGIEMSSRELAGANYIGEIWQSLRTPEPGQPKPATIDPDDRRNRTFGTTAQAAALAAAGAENRTVSGLALVRAVGDGSGLTLDPELPTFYAMDAVTVKLPRLKAVTIAA